MPLAMKRTASASRMNVTSAVPETGCALCVAPACPAPATTKLDVLVCVAPVASVAVATMLWGPGSSGIAGVYIQLPLASAVTTTVCGVE